jgi:ABC-2 type transport system permease protein
MTKRRNTFNTTSFLIALGIIILVNIISSFLHGYVDLTEDKRFTLTEPTKKLVRGLDDVIYIRVLLDGDFPAGFKRLQAATDQILNDLRKLNNNIQFEFDDPNSGTGEERKARQEQLIKMGIYPTALKYFDGKELVQKNIFPYAVISFADRRIAVNLLEEQLPGMDEQIVLNNSVSLLEYKFSHALQNLMLQEKKNIAFTTGNEEIEPQKLLRLERELRRFYNTGRLNLDSLIVIDQALNLLIVPGPKAKMDPKNQFKIDQYIMNGGKVLWMVETSDASLDSIAKYQTYTPMTYDLGYDELLFKYGVRVQPNLLMDMECSTIPQIVGMAGDQPQTMMFGWYYHPLITPKSNHPIVKNIGQVNMFFPSTIDVLQTKSNITQTVLLESSPYAKFQFNPGLTFNILRDKPDPSSFNKGPLVLAVLLEGEFESAFINRIPSDFKVALDQLNMEFRERSVPTAQIVISNVDFVKNLVDPQTGETINIGFNKWERRFFKGNQDFILNAIEYLLDESGVLVARSKEVKLRLLDAVKTQEEKKFWQSLNIIAPLIFLFAVGLVYHFRRKRKFGIKSVSQ